MEQFLVNAKELVTRNDFARLLLDLIRPLRSYYSPGHAFLKLGNTAAHYGEKAAEMEGFSRVLWGVGPLLATDNTDLSVRMRDEIEEWRRLYLDGLVHGTDPNCDEYWGDVQDYDQKMVEMASIATAFLLSPQALWEPLSDAQKENVTAWMNQINQKNVYANNWRFFRILVNVFFTVQDLHPDTKRLQEDLQVIEECYDGEGWYFDGKKSQMDYYIPFAMHYYGLIYAHFMDEVDSQRCQKFRERAEIFSKDFVYWFSRDGSEVPFGRSLTYRFAHSGFFAALALAVPKEDQGVEKGMLLRNFRYWIKQPILDHGGILSVGYGYPNLIASDDYNAPGSPYWALKSFLPLAFPSDHPFWSLEEKAVLYQAKKLLSHPHMILTHTEDHVQMYPVGQHFMEKGQSAAKYEKFVYSNQFGFSVSRGTTLEAGAFDNTLAVSPAGEECYRMRYGVDSFEVTEEYTRTSYHIGKKVQIETLILPLPLGHVRIHVLTTKEAIDIAEGGYAIAREQSIPLVTGRKSGKYSGEMIEKSADSILCRFPWGNSGITAIGVSEGVHWEPRLIHPFPNTNLLCNLTVIPTLCATLPPGNYLFGDYVWASNRENPKELPRLSCAENMYILSWDSKEIKIPVLQT